MIIEAQLASDVTLLLVLMVLSRLITPSMPQSGRPIPAHEFMFRSNFFIVLACVDSLVVSAVGVSHHAAKVGGTIPERCRCTHCRGGWLITSSTWVS